MPEIVRPASTADMPDLMESLGVPVRTVEPSRRKKWDAATCARVTDYTGRTNEHARDALRLVYGRSVPPAHRLA